MNEDVRTTSELSPPVLANPLMLELVCRDARFSAVAMNLARLHIEIETVRWCRQQVLPEIRLHLVDSSRQIHLHRQS